MTIDLHDIARQWYDIFKVSPDGKGIGWLIGQADNKAHQYAELGTAYLDLQPGNGYSYKMVLHDLLYEQAKVLAAKADINRPDPADPESDYFRDQAMHAGPAAIMGGELLVAIPEWHRSFVLNHVSLHTPDYIEEKMKLGLVHAVPIAIFLSQFSHAATALRDG